MKQCKEALEYLGLGSRLDSNNGIDFPGGCSYQLIGPRGGRGVWNVLLENSTTRSDTHPVCKKLEPTLEPSVFMECKANPDVYFQRWDDWVCKRMCTQPDYCHSGCKRKCLESCTCNRLPPRRLMEQESLGDWVKEE